MKKFGYSTYLSPFTWRYGSDEMRKIWSEENKRKLWRKVWVALARAQHKQGLVSKKELDDLIKYQNNIDIEKAHEFEKEIKHDLMSEIKVYALQAKIGGGKIHLGATSMDIEDNTDSIRIRESLKIIEERLRELIKIFAKQIDRYKDLVCMGYTHLQPAEPTTLGYRFSNYAYDLLLDYQLLQFIKAKLKAKGMKGAVGTSASYVSLTNLKTAQAMEEEVMKDLGLESILISSQTSPRKFEVLIASLLSSIAESLYKFAFDVRIMQSPGFCEWQEPFDSKQVGSSAMPFKKNPIKSEQVCSLARLVFHLSEVSIDNAANMLLERTLDDSANRRVYLPEMFLAVDEMLKSTQKIIDGLVIKEQNVEKNLEKFGQFSSIEALLMECVKNGGDRQELHEIFRKHAMKAYEESNKKDNHLVSYLVNDVKIMKFIDKERLQQLTNVRKHVGLASQRCKEFLKILEHELSS